MNDLKNKVADLVRVYQTADQPDQEDTPDHQITRSVEKEQLTRSDQISAKIS
jgi:hypothetical protein